MSIRTETIGQIGGKGCRPTKTTKIKKDKDGNIVRDKKTGKPIETSFLRFTMYSDNPREAKVLDEESNTYKTFREPIQVVLPDTPRGHNVFEYLEPGRMVLVTGDLTVNPRAVEDKIYKNIKLAMTDIKLLDSPRPRQMKRAIQDQVEAGIISEDEGKSAMAKMDEFYSKRMDNAEPPRIYIDETGKAEKQAAIDSDPDAPDFNDN